MAPATLLLLSGRAAALGGALRIAAAFVPWRPGSAGLEAFYFVIDVCLLFGLVGIYGSVASRLGVVAALGFGAALVGLASIVGPDPVAFGIDFHATGAAALALGLAVMAVSMARRRVFPLWIPVLWIATPVLAVAGAALGWGELGSTAAGVAFGAAFLGAGLHLSRAPDEPGAAARRPTGIDLNQVTLPAADLQDSIDFYTRFGLELIVDSPENRYARFEIPGSEATLSVHVGEPTVQVYFETARPEQAVERIRQAGIDPVEPLRNQPWLWREAVYLDPAGNRLCVYSAGENRKNPPWRVGR